MSEKESEPTRAERPSWILIGVAVAIMVIGSTLAVHYRKLRQTRGHGTVTTLDRPRQAPDAHGRTGDLVLTDSSGATIAVQAAPNIAGHRPLLGAIVDVSARDGDVSDPVIWFRTVTADAADKTTGLDMTIPSRGECSDGSVGIRAIGALGVRLASLLCPLGDGRFTLTTRVPGLADQMIADEINVGGTPVIIANQGAVWDMEADTGFLAFADAGTAVLLEAHRMHVSRTFSRFGAETFPSPVLVRYGPGETVSRSLRVVTGDVFSALAFVPGPARTVTLTFGPDRGGQVSLRDDAARELAAGTVAPGEVRALRVPSGLGTHLLLRDDAGVVTDARVPLLEPGREARVEASRPASATLSFAYSDDAGKALAVHVLVRGVDGAPDPVFGKVEPRVVPAGRSVYAIDGKARLAVAPGKYRVTASHGLAFTLSVRDVTAEATSEVVIVDTLRRVVATDGWLSADFHLHSSPSPDSVVSLEDRVASLVCEGVELAVATDHNHVTDLAPSARALGAQERLHTLVGVEITSPGQWGHFNAFPLAMPQGAPEEGTPVYYDKLPAEMFASAHAMGARIVQVNHARMEPRIGYFDLAHLDPKTGHAGPVFSADFETFEAFNGMWIETRAKVREGPTDVVALARYGKRVTVAGNSDSHKLLYEEAGYPRTWIHTPAEPVATRGERTLSTLLQGDTTVSSGPFVEVTAEDRPIGSVVAPDGSGSVRLHVRVSAPAWVPLDHVEILLDDAVVERFTVEGAAVDGIRFERDVKVSAAGRDHVVIVWAEGDRPLPDVVPYEHALSIGFTGPIYVDGDGDGAVKMAPAG